MIKAITSNEYVLVAKITDNSIDILHLSKYQNQSQLLTIFNEINNFIIDDYRFLLPSSKQKNFKISASLNLGKKPLSKEEKQMLTKACIDILPPDCVPVSTFDEEYSLYKDNTIYTYHEFPDNLIGEKLSLTTNIVTIDKQDHQAGLALYQPFKGHTLNVFTRYQGIKHYLKEISAITSFQLVELEEQLTVTTIENEKIDHRVYHYSLNDFFQNILANMDNMINNQTLINYISLEDFAQIFKDNNKIDSQLLITSYQKELDVITNLIKDVVNEEIKLNLFFIGNVLENEEAIKYLSSNLKRQISTWDFITIVSRRSDLIPLIGGLFID